MGLVQSGSEVDDPELLCLFALLHPEGTAGAAALGRSPAALGSSALKQHQSLCWDAGLTRACQA